MARQIAQATVNVFPSMKGFNTAIYAEFGSAGTQAGNRFNKGFTSSISGLKNTLTAMGNAYKQAIGANPTNSGAGDKLAEQRIQAQNRLLSASKAVEAQEYKVQSARLRVEGATKQLANLETQLVRARLAGKDTSGLEARIATAKARVADATAKQTREEQKLQAVQAKHSTAQSNVDNLTQAYSRLTRTVTPLGNTLQRAGTQLRNLQNITGGTSLTGLADNLTRAGNLMSSLRTHAGAVGSALKTGFTMAMPALRDLISGIGGAVSELGGLAVGAVAGIIGSNVSGAVQRYDIIQRFPETMKAMGVSSRDAQKSLELLTNGIEGLPTKLPEIIQTFNQILPVMNNDVERTTKLTIALNNAMLAGGNGAEEAQRGLTQLLQLFSSGSFSDLRGWRSAMEVANVSMTQLARYMMGDAKASALGLWDALKAGTYTMEDLQDAFIALNEGVDGYVSFSELAQANTVGIDTSMRNMNTAVQNAIASFLDMSGAGALIRETLDKITEGLKSFRHNLDPLGSEISELEFQIDDLIEQSNQQAELGIDTTETERQIVELQEKLEGLQSRRTTAGIDALRAKLGMSGNGLGGALGLAVGALLPMLRHVPLLGRLFTRVTGPIGLVVGGITAMWTNSESLRNWFGKLWDKMGETGTIDRLSGLMSSLSNVVGNVAGAIGDLLATLLGGEDGATTFVNAINTVIDTLKALLDTISVVVLGLKAVFTRDLDDIDAFRTAFDDMVASWGQVGEDIKTAFDDADTSVSKASDWGLNNSTLSAEMNDIKKSAQEGSKQVDALGRSFKVSGDNFKQSGLSGFLNRATYYSPVAIGLDWAASKTNMNTAPGYQGAGVGYGAYSGGISDARKAGEDTATAYNQELSNGIEGGTKTVEKSLSSLIGDLGARARMQFMSAGGGGGGQFGNSVATGIRGQTGNVSNAGGSLIASTVNRMSAGVGSAHATGSRVGQNTAGGINASSGQAVGAGSSLMSRVYSAMSGMLGSFQGLGSSIASGLTKGINLGSSGVSSSASTLVSKAYEAAKKRADVNSPSKLFRDGIGLSIGEGLAVGIEQSTPMVTTAVENAITDASKVANTMGISLGVDSNIASQGRLGGNMGMSGGNYTQNITLYETNPASVAQVIENRWTQLVGV